MDVSGRSFIAAPFAGMTQTGSMGLISAAARGTPSRCSYDGDFDGQRQGLRAMPLFGHSTPSLVFFPLPLWERVTPSGSEASGEGFASGASEKTSAEEQSFPPLPVLA